MELNCSKHYRANTRNSSFDSIQRTFWGGQCKAARDDDLCAAGGLGAGCRAHHDVGKNSYDYFVARDVYVMSGFFLRDCEDIARCLAVSLWNEIQVKFRLDVRPEDVIWSDRHYRLDIGVDGSLRGACGRAVVQFDFLQKGEIFFAVCGEILRNWSFFVCKAVPVNLSTLLQRIMMRTGRRFTRLFKKHGR